MAIIPDNEAARYGDVTFGLVVSCSSVPYAYEIVCILMILLAHYQSILFCLHIR